MKRLLITIIIMVITSYCVMGMNPIKDLTITPVTVIQVTNQNNASRAMRGSLAIKAY